MFTLLQGQLNLSFPGLQQQYQALRTSPTDTHRMDVKKALVSGSRELSTKRSWKALSLLTKKHTNATTTSIGTSRRILSDMTCAPSSPVHLKKYSFHCSVSGNSGVIVICFTRSFSVNQAIREIKRPSNGSVCTTDRSTTFTWKKTPLMLDIFSGELW